MNLFVNEYAFALGAKAILIDVKPILKRNLCHYNTWKMLQVLNQKEKR